MKECGRFEKTIEAYIAGEPVAGELEALVEHCKECRSCRELLAVHRDMSDLGARFDELEDPDYDSLRAAVMEQVATTSMKRRPLRGVWANFLAPFSLQPLTAAALLVVVFFIGIVAGQFRPGTSNGITGPLLEEINAEAVANRSLSDVEDSPYTYSNVSFRRLDGDRVALGFDVTKHMEVVEPAGSALVKEVLVQSLMNPAPTGSRLEAVSFASNVHETKVKQALLFAMRNDENLAVRLRALDILSAQPGDAEIDAAVLATLRDDESVQMRMQALDYLAARSVDRDLLRRTIEERGADRPGADGAAGRIPQVIIEDYWGVRRSRACSEQRFALQRSWCLAWCSY